MLLRAILRLRSVLRNAAAARRLHPNPLDTCHVRHVELADDLGRNRLVVLGLRLLDLLLQFGETFGAILRLVGLDERLGILLDLLRKRGRGLAHDGERGCIYMEPEVRVCQDEDQTSRRQHTHFLSKSPHWTADQPPRVS